MQLFLLPLFERDVDCLITTKTKIKGMFRENRKDSVGLNCLTLLEFDFICVWKWEVKYTIDLFCLLWYLVQWKYERKIFMTSSFVVVVCSMDLLTRWTWKWGNFVWNLFEQAFYVEIMNFYLRLVSE